MGGRHIRIPHSDGSPLEQISNFTSQQDHGGYEPLYLKLELENARLKKEKRDLEAMILMFRQLLVKYGSQSKEYRTLIEAYDLNFKIEIHTHGTINRT